MFLFWFCFSGLLCKTKVFPNQSTLTPEVQLSNQCLKSCLRYDQRGGDSACGWIFSISSIPLSSLIPEIDAEQREEPRSWEEKKNPWQEATPEGAIQYDRWPQEEDLWLLIRILSNCVELHIFFNCFFFLLFKILIINMEQQICGYYKMLIQTFPDDVHVRQNPFNFWRTAQI